MTGACPCGALYLSSVRFLVVPIIMSLRLAKRSSLLLKAVNYSQKVLLYLSPNEKENLFFLCFNFHSMPPLFLLKSTTQSIGIVRHSLFLSFCIFFILNPLDFNNMKVEFIVPSIILDHFGRHLTFDVNI
jgi:hypothetical protein